MCSAFLSALIAHSYDAFDFSPSSSLSPAIFAAFATPMRCFRR